MRDVRDLCRAFGLAPALGERLARPDYRSDFRERESHLVGRSSWKLERRQHFEEQNHPSREALRRGDWDEALRLMAARREGVLRAEREAATRRYAFHRVRVVEEPFTPYVQWELHSLRIQAECGRRIRVVDAERVRSLEAPGLLPELVILGGATLYEVCYTDEGVPNGAVRYTDPDLVACCEAFISRLYAEGEDVRSYFDRKVAPLPSPELTGRAG
ncbi:DUF6879 family protein [Streptomyces sp. 6N223]|uniref:DUF6879 family protein n=1 Tax=Streptomyces sp. 6N223 TaxID=3457412 RepID=UPI003FD374FF